MRAKAHGARCGAPWALGVGERMSGQKLPLPPLIAARLGRIGACGGCGGGRGLWGYLLITQQLMASVEVR